MGEAPKRDGLAFEVIDASVRFGELAALAQVSATVQAGEPVAIVGPSGAGKTTLLRLLSGQLPASGGQVNVGGRRIAALDDGQLRRLRSRIGFVHQDLRLIPQVRVLKNVLAGRLGRWSWLGSLARMTLPSRRLVLEAHEVLERVGVEDKLYERTDRLSGGEQQRVALARALFQGPGALLADEPIASVDPRRSRQILSLLTEVCAERGMTLVASLHDVTAAREFFPRLIGLRYGRVVFDRPTSDVSAAALTDLYRLGERMGGGESS